MSLDWELFDEFQPSLGSGGIVPSLDVLLARLDLIGVARDTLERVRLAVLPHLESEHSPGLRIFLPRHRFVSNKGAGVRSFFLVMQGESPRKQLELYLYD